MIVLPTDTKAVSEGYHYDELRAEKACQFTEKFLKVTKGPITGQPFRLLQWQKEIVETLFGWVNQDGNRRFRYCFILIPKKNGKSELCAALLLTLLMLDGEYRPEYYLAAPSKEQLKDGVFKSICSMTKTSPELAKRLHIVPNRYRVLYPKNDGHIQVIAADAGNAEGYDSSVFVVDELHAIKRREFLDAIEYAGSARKNYLRFDITTAGNSISSPAYEKYSFAKKVNNGEIPDIHTLPVIYEMAEGDEWDDVAVWSKCNPAIGTVLSMEQFQSDYQNALATPSKVNAFKRYRLNVWTNEADSWIPVVEWKRNEQATIPDLHGKKCFGGLDISASRDLTSFALFFPGDISYVKVWHFIPKDNAKDKELEDRVPYLTWAREGYIEMTTGNVVDQKTILQRIIAICHEYGASEVAIDMWNAQYISQELLQNNIVVVPYSLSYKSMDAPTKEVEKMVYAGTLHHGPNPVLDWEIGNIIIDCDSNENQKPNKRKSTGRIDGIVALLMAVGRQLAVEADGISVFDYDKLQT